MTLLEMYVHKRQFNKYCEKEMPSELKKTKIVSEDEFKESQDKGRDTM